MALRRGSLVGDAYVRIHADSSAVDNELKRELNAAAKPASKEFISNLDKAMAAEAKGKLQNANREIVKGIVGGKKEWDAQFKKSGLASVDEFARSVRRRLIDIGDAAEQAGKPFQGLEDGLESITVWARGNHDTRVVRFINAFKNGRVHVQTFSDILGRSFGKGSRNNFLNFTGSVVAGLAKISGLFIHSGISVLQAGLKTATVLGRGFYGVFSGIGQLMSGGGSSGLVTGIMDFGKGIGDLAKLFGTTLLAAASAALPVLVGIGAALSAMAIVLPPLLSLIGSLAGLLVMLAGSISIGLVGGLLVVAPLIAGLVGGLGATVLAFTNMEEKSKKATKALKPLTDAWGKMMKTIQGPILDRIAGALGELATPLTKYVIPAIEAFGEAASNIIADFAIMANSKQFEPFLKIWSEQLPDIFQNLGVAFNNFFFGLTAFFAPILQYAEDLSLVIGDVAMAFSEWASSAEGQNAIADFMKVAWERAQDVWDILVLLGEAIAGLFTSGDENGGGDFLENIRSSLEGLVAWIQDPDNGLAKWFQDAYETGVSLWEGLKDIAEALKTIDWDSAAQNVQTVISFVSTLTAYAINFVTAWNAYVEGIGIGWRQIGQVFVTIYNATLGPVFDKVLGGISAIMSGLETFFRALGQIPNFEWADTAADKMGEAARQADKLGDDLRNIDDVNVNVHVGLSGPGVALLHKAQSRKNPDVYYGLAAGGILSGATMIRPNVMAGEAGREAVVPLDRPLSQVDPSVRALAAFAQGQTKMMASGGMVGGGTTIEAGAIVVQAPYSDPALVAESVFDALAAGIKN